jgi:regulator of protease activity HflC (stomatin/prohibitin superfamily)
MGLFFILQEKEEALIQSFGKYVKTVKQAGPHLIMPWQNVAARVGMELKQVEDKLATKTKDDIFVTIPIKMHLQIIDSKKFVYDSNKPIEQVMARVNATAKQLVSGMEFIELYKTREQISEMAREKVGKEIENLYGVKLIDVIVDEPQADSKAMASFSGVKESERNKLAAQNNAEARKIEIIAEAEARKEALRLHGEGIAEQRNAIFQNYAEQFNNLAKKGMSPDMAHEVITLAMSLDTTRDAAEKGNLIVSTTNASELISQMQTLGKTLTKPPAPARPANDDGADVKAPKLG